MIRAFIIFWSIQVALFSQNNVATTSAAFLEIGAGARSLGMGSAFVAVADNPSGLYWNPAGITYATEVEVESFYSPWLAETQFYNNTAIVPMGRLGTMGLSFTAVTMDEMMVRTVTEPEPSEYGQRFSAGSIAMGLSYARLLTDRFSFGVQAKYIQENIWQMSASGLSIDIGTLFYTRGNTRIGMSISNFGGKLKMGGINTLVDIDVDENIYGNNDRIDGDLGTGNWPLPLIFRFGLGKKFDLSKEISCLTTLDAIHPNNNPEYLNIGLEYSLKNSLFLRIGRSHTFYKLKYLDNEKNHTGPENGISFGLGLKYNIPLGPMLEIDYVMTDYGVFKNIGGYSITARF